MNIIIIIVSLAIERYLHLGSALKRFQWFPAFSHWLKSTLKSEAIWGKWQGLAVLIVPVVLLVAFVLMILHGVHAGLAELIFGIVVLFYCLGPVDFYQTAESYLQAGEKTAESDEDKEALAAELAGPGAKKPVTVRAVTEGMFQSAHQRIFAVLFWFVVLGPLGPVGAILYRLTTVIRDMSQSPKSEFHVLAESSVMLQGILDWIPIRLNALIYVLVGNFNDGFSVWIKQVTTGWKNNAALLSECGMAALGVKNAKGADASLPELALSIIDRGFVVLLVLIAVYDMGRWLY